MQVYVILALRKIKKDRITSPSFPTPLSSKKNKQNPKTTSWKACKLLWMLQLGAAGEPGAPSGTSPHKEWGDPQLPLAGNTSQSSWTWSGVICSHKWHLWEHVFHTCRGYWNCAHIWMGKVNAVHATKTPSNEGGINTASFKLLLQYTLKIPNISKK